MGLIMRLTKDKQYNGAGKLVEGFEVAIAVQKPELRFGLDARGEFVGPNDPKDVEVTVPNPELELQSLFDSIQLPCFEDQPARLCALNARQMQDALDMAVEEFGRIVPPESVRPVLRGVSPSLSFGIDAGGLLIGAYLISKRSCFSCGPNMPRLEHRPALQGEALVVSPPARGKGFGSLL